MPHSFREILMIISGILLLTISLWSFPDIKDNNTTCNEIRSPMKTSVKEANQ